MKVSIGVNSLPRKVKFYFYGRNDLLPSKLKPFHGSKLLSWKQPKIPGSKNYFHESFHTSKFACINLFMKVNIKLNVNFSFMEIKVEFQ